MTNKVLSLIGLWVGVGGAIIVASNTNHFFIGYLLFLISSIAWIIYAFRTKQNNLLIMNIIFGFINAIGLYNFS